MNEDFDLPILYKGKELLLRSRLLHYGYSYKIEVELDGSTLLFEPDESRQWRAVLPYGETEKTRRPDPELMHAIIAALDQLLE